MENKTKKFFLFACIAQLIAACDSLYKDSGTSAGPLVKVHVNQVALEREGPKSAIVEIAQGGRPAAGSFDILSGDVVVLSGQLTVLPAFTEWGDNRQYLKADFTALKQAGVFTVRANIGGQAFMSAPITLGDNAQFSKTVKAILGYFKANRHTDKKDRRLRIYQTERFVDVWGGWQDAGGDKGKYLSHLSYANFMNPQQAALVVWALAESYQRMPHLYQEAGLEAAVVEEALWGADYLHRILDPQGYFYITVFDRWGDPRAERMVTGYVGAAGVYTNGYQAAFREGGGVAIAALARAYRLSERTAVAGEFSAEQYLQDAQRAYAHLVDNNHKYCDDGQENIIDDYTALLAAVELYRATEKAGYLQAARQRAASLNSRLTPEGWFVSDDGNRPFFHGAEAGFPIVSLVQYMQIETDTTLLDKARKTVQTALDYQLALNRKVSNPFNYARQSFRTWHNAVYSASVLEGFFIPHANETDYWWQGESARLSSLAVAAILGGRVTAPAQGGAFGVSAELATFSQNQLDWTLGRNPFDMCMLYGFGVNNPPSAESAGDMVNGGISNGITGAVGSDEGRGIVFAPGPDAENWRWLEQWLPHSTWFLLAVTAMAE